MRALILGAVLGATAVLPVAALAVESQSVPASDIEIVKADFGVFNIGADGQMGFTPTHTVPLKEGQNYGWIMVVKTAKKTVHWREEFKLPAAAPWNVGEAGAKISQDQTASVIEQDRSLADAPIVLNMWSVARGDPSGHYVISVTLDNTVTRTFEFDVR